jgi:signal transduction histidine kinase/CheY-like chemotaxis protein
MSASPASPTLLAPQPRRSTALHYGMAVLAVVFALLIRWPLTPLFGGSVPFMFFFPAIMFAAWFGGLGPGLLATVLSAVGANYLLVSTTAVARLPGSGSRIAQLVVFTTIGIFMSLLNERLHAARRRDAEAAEKNRRQAEELRQAESAARESEERFRVSADAAETARREAESASRSKDEFLATVSHELRTPLNAILGWAQLLLTSDVDVEKTRRGLETIARNAKLQAQLIDDLLDVSRIISGKMRLDVRALDLVPVVDAALEAIRPAAEAKQIRLRRVLDPLAGPVAGDPARLQQVVWNLLSNAVKFTPKEGLVEVRLERVNSHVEIIVADNGPGIAPDFLPHVFDRFRQSDASTTRRQGGLGLGLAIVRHLVELHGGTVRAKSPGEGHGSTFVVLLPLSIVHMTSADGQRVHPRAEADGPDCEDDATLNLKGIRVLVVDDEPDARETMQQILEHCDAEVRTAASAAEGLQALQEWQPHVLLSDIGMPGEDGYGLIRQVRALPPERGGRTPAAALTAFARGEDRRRALMAGFQMHVAKPVEVNELAAVVASLAKGR